MTNINFYVSNQNGLEYRLGIVYKLIGHALKRQLFVHIHTENEQMNKQVDDWLWTANKPSFIPHQIITNTQIQYTNKTDDSNVAKVITISHDFEPIHNCDYLINLSVRQPSFFSRFTKLAEVLDNSEDILTAGRKRYVFYRDRGYTLAYHKL